MGESSSRVYSIFGRFQMSFDFVQILIEIVLHFGRQKKLENYLAFFDLLFAFSVISGRAVGMNSTFVLEKCANVTMSIRRRVN